MNNRYQRRRMSSVSKNDQKRLPFWRDDKGRIGFNPRPGININYGVMFDPKKGHRVFFNYADTPEFKNTWGTKSLRAYLKDNFVSSSEELVHAKKTYLASCDLADQMDRIWRESGRPAEGVPEPKGTMQ